MYLPIAELDGQILWAIFFVAVLLFGGTKIPELARALGKAKREYKKASEDINDEVKNIVDEDDRRQARLKALEQEEREKRSGDGHKN
jgi:sec-independent protein translocase protein TatA